MALRAVPEHPKFAQLKLALGLSKYEALGVLEALWHFTGKYTPQGNVGKFKDSAIEAWLEWKGDPGALVAALIDAEWLDRSEEHRLVVHDWKDHADQTTKKQIGRLSKRHVQDMSGQTGKASGPPVPVPAPVPEPAKEKQKPSRDKRESDPRHAEFRQIAGEYWRSRNKIDMPWDGGEAKQLAMLLAANPGLDGDAFRELLRNRHRSQVNHSERPRAWIARATDYTAGPLDRFNKPPETSNGNRTSKADATLSALTRSIQAGRDQIPPGADGCEAWSGDRSG